MIHPLIHALLANAAVGGALALQIPNLPIPFAAILAQAAVPGLEQFLTLLQTISLLIGITLILYGAWQLHQGRISEGILSCVAGFICCIAVPIIRLIAGWTGGTL
ncbi:MAG: hypothetical protein AB7O66_25145 [Limisphaerales bacterium]